MDTLETLAEAWARKVGNPIDSEREWLERIRESPSWREFWRMAFGDSENVNPATADLWARTEQWLSVVE